MEIISGLTYKKGEFIEGHIIVENDSARFFDGLHEKPDMEGLIIPGLMNCHMHIGDSGIPRPPKGSVEEIVGPPNGYKHRKLRELSEIELKNAMSDCIDVMIQRGIHGFLDFREGGLKGANSLLETLIGKDIRCDIYSRPSRNDYDHHEIESLLRISNGIGISALADWEKEKLSEIALHCSSEKKPLGIHASEAIRENIGDILDLGPKFLVHMIRASTEDLEECAEAQVPVIVCPRANGFFDIRPPIDEMMKAGIDICLGTDNAMLATADVFEEMRAVRSLSNPDVISDVELLGIVFDNSRKVLNSNLSIGVESWGYDGFIVLKNQVSDPIGQVLRSKGGDILYQWRPR